MLLTLPPAFIKLLLQCSEDRFGRDLTSLSVLRPIWSAHPVTVALSHAHTWARLVFGYGIESVISSAANDQDGPARYLRPGLVSATHQLRLKAGIFKLLRLLRDEQKQRAALMQAVGCKIRGCTVAQSVDASMSLVREQP